MYDDTIRRVLSNLKPVMFLGQMDVVRDKEHLSTSAPCGEDVYEYKSSIGEPGNETIGMIMFILACAIALDLSWKQFSNCHGRDCLNV